MICTIMQFSRTKMPKNTTKWYIYFHFLVICAIRKKARRICIIHTLPASSENDKCIFYPLSIIVYFKGTFTGTPLLVLRFKASEEG